MCGREVVGAGSVSQPALPGKPGGFKGQILLASHSALTLRGVRIRLTLGQRDGRRLFLEIFEETARILV